MKLKQLNAKDNIDRDPFGKTQKSLKDLRTEIMESKKVEKLESRKVEKLESGRVQFPYDRKWDKRDFIIENKGNNTASVRVKKMGEDWKRYTQDNTSLRSWSEGKPIDIDLTNQTTFNKWMWEILDKYIWDDRKAVPEKWKQAYNLLKEDNSESTETTKKSLKNKPINLWYKETYSEKDMILENFPSVSYSEMITQEITIPEKIIRCLRWKPVTDAIEDRYGIPRWLLMALMSQEGAWDPTIPNVTNYKTIDKKMTISKSDWWVWLIHTQPYLWDQYWLKIVEPFDDTKNYWESLRDFDNWDKVRKIYSKTRDLKELIKHDDRRHPIMWLDAFARMLVSEKKTWTDKWFYTVNRRVGWWKKHVYEVFDTRATINKINNEPIDYSNMSEWLKTSMKNAESGSDYTTTKKYLDDMKVTIEWYEWTDYKTYYKYFENQCKNYGLSKYKKLWKY